MKSRTVEISFINGSHEIVDNVTQTLWDANIFSVKTKDKILHFPFANMLRVVEY